MQKETEEERSQLSFGNKKKLRRRGANSHLAKKSRREANGHLVTRRSQEDWLAVIW